MDGHFVPNLTIGPVVIEAIRPRTHLPLDVHLMIEDPDKYIEAFAKAGANLISAHFEACTHLNRTLQHIKSLGCSAGVVVNPATPVELLQDALQDADFVLVMSVNPGFGGQKFIPHALAKIERLRAMREKSMLAFAIEIDGGISGANIRDALKAGAELSCGPSRKNPVAMRRSCSAGVVGSPARSSSPASCSRIN